MRHAKPSVARHRKNYKDDRVERVFISVQHYTKWRECLLNVWIVEGVRTEKVVEINLKVGPDSRK